MSQPAFRASDDNSPKLPAGRSYELPHCCENSKYEETLPAHLRSRRSCIDDLYKARGCLRGRTCYFTCNSAEGSHNITRYRAQDSSHLACNCTVDSNDAAGDLRDYTVHRVVRGWYDDNSTSSRCGCCLLARDIGCNRT